MIDPTTLRLPNGRIPRPGHAMRRPDGSEVSELLYAHECAEAAKAQTTRDAAPVAGIWEQAIARAYADESFLAQVNRIAGGM